MKYLISFFIVLSFAQNASAYHIGDHRTITRQAFKELATCYPRAQALLNVEWLVSGDVDEDLNLIQKELFWAHFFNPYKHLRMIRSDSAARINYLVPSLHPSSSANFDSAEMYNVGHVIHHFQDMTVPAHVVPVNHSMFDGFETYDFSGDISSGWSCADLGSMYVGDLQSVLIDTAKQTLENLKTTAIDVVAVTGGVQNRIVLSGKAFWEESNDDSFGVYGYLGNNFGETSFRTNSVDYQLPADYAAKFKQRQMRLAVQSTLRGLLWELGPQFVKDRLNFEPFHEASVTK